MKPPTSASSSRSRLLRAVLVGLSAVPLMGLSCPSGFGPAPIEPTSASVMVEPAHVSAQVGSTQRFDAKVASDSDPFGGTVSWGTTPALIIEEANRTSWFATVKCLTAGPGIITATAYNNRSETLGSGTAQMDCVPAPPPPGPGVSLFELNPGLFRFEHRVGESACPQNLGPLGVTNTSDQVLQLNAASGNEAIDVRPTQTSVPPRGSQPFTIEFNCRTRTSFVTTITIRGTAGATTETKSAEVNATIR